MNAQQLDCSLLANLQLETRADPQTVGYKWNALRDRAKHRPEITQDEMRRHLEAIAAHLDAQDAERVRQVGELWDTVGLDW